MNIIKRIQLEICWRRGHRLYLGENPSCGTCQDKKHKKSVKRLQSNRRGMMEYTTCVCGHELEEHGKNGTCQVEGCLCAGYEQEDEGTATSTGGKDAELVGKESLASPSVRGNGGKEC